MGPYSNFTNCPNTIIYNNPPHPIAGSHTALSWILLVSFNLELFLNLLSVMRMTFFFLKYRPAALKKVPYFALVYFLMTSLRSCILGRNTWWAMLRGSYIHKVDLQLRGDQGQSGRWEKTRGLQPPGQKRKGTKERVTNCTQYCEEVKLDTAPFSSGGHWSHFRERLQWLVEGEASSWC